MTKRTVDSAGNAFECLLRYDFLVAGEKHDVQLEHKLGEWRLLADGDEVNKKKHNKKNILTSAKHNLVFCVKQGTAQEVQGGLLATWIIAGAKWNYSMNVNNMTVELAWSKQTGEAGLPLVEVLGNVSDNAEMENLEPSNVPAATQEQQPRAAPEKIVGENPESKAQELTAAASEPLQAVTTVVTVAALEQEMAGLRKDLAISMGKESPSPHTQIAYVSPGNEDIYLEQTGGSVAVTEKACCEPAHCETGCAVQ